MIITGGWTELPIHSFPYTVPSVNGCRCIFYRKNIFANSCDRARENGDLFFFFFFFPPRETCLFFFFGTTERWKCFSMDILSDEWFLACRHFSRLFHVSIYPLNFLSLFIFWYVYIYFFFFYSWNIIMIETCRCCWKQLSQSRKQNWSVWSETEMGNFSFPTNETKR